MKILSLKMRYSDEKWPIYLDKIFGKGTAEKMYIESRATASTHEAKISLLNFKRNSKIIDIIKTNESVISAFIIDDNSGDQPT